MHSLLNFMLWRVLAYFTTGLKVETVCSSQTLAQTYTSTWYHIIETLFCGAVELETFTTEKFGSKNS